MASQHNDGERWTIEKRIAGSGDSRHLVLDVDGPDTERIEVVRASRADALAEALRAIRDTDPTDNALDPQRPARIATAVLGRIGAAMFQRRVEKAKTLKLRANEDRLR